VENHRERMRFDVAATRLLFGGSGLARQKGASPLTKRITYRVSEEDYATYLAKVAEARMSASEFFREAVLKNRTSIVARPSLSIDRQRLLFVVNKTSNNLNQIAHRANSANLKGALSDDKLESMLYQLQIISRYLKATLGEVD
jgi:hypothetical protein